MSRGHIMRSCSVSNGPCCSHRGNVEAEAMVLQVDLVSMVTSDGHRQWQQWEGRSLSMRHYNNKGNLKVNRRMNHLKQQIQLLLQFAKCNVIVVRKYLCFNITQKVSSFRRFSKSNHSK